MKTIQVCTYSRVSTTVQDYKRQVNDIKQYCQAFNYIIVNEFAEKESGKKKKRPALTSLLEYCKENKNTISFVIVSELSRLGRTSEVLNTIEILNNLQIGLISLKENIQTLNPDKSINHTSSMVLSILSSINSYELETMKYRSKSGLLNSAKKGHVGGGKMWPYGYMKESEISKKLVINPIEAEIIKEIFDMYLNGKGTLKISTILNSKNIPTRTNKKWRDKVVYDIICNSIYCGQRRFKNEIVNAPAIITEDQYLEANKIRKENYNKQTINSKFEYLLNEKLIKCGVCNKSYFAHKRTSGKDNSYKCISIRYNDNCGNTAISIDKLEYAVKYVFVKDLLKLITINFEENEQLLNEIQSYKIELKKLERQQSKLIDLYTSTDNITKDEYKRKSDIIKTSEGKILKMLKECQTKENNLKKSSKIAFANFTLTDNNLYKLVKLDISKEYIQQVIERIVITKDEKKLTENKQDKTIKVEIISFAGNSITIYLSQRSKFFLYNNEKIEYKN
jgi:site-specific DNA recombinase